MTARHLLLGLDGAGLDIVESFGPERLPHLHALIRGGVCAPLRSTIPPATLPAWTTLLTGVGPGRHGVFDFTTRDGYRVHFTAGTVRQARTLAALLDARGRKTALVGFPATWPPERLRHGIAIGGWDSPVAFEADRSFVHPPELFDELVRRFGPWRFDDVDEAGDHDEGEWHAALGGKLVERIVHRTEVARWLLGRDEWDLFAFYFGESDTASHHLWSLHDPQSPRHPTESDRTGAGPRGASGLLDVYRALDSAVGQLVEAAGRDVEITITSDHGSGGSSDSVVYLNRVLADAGLLRFRDDSGLSSAIVGALRRSALGRVPPAWRQRLFALGGKVLPNWLESRVRFGAIDLARTSAFSEELNYFPSVSLNLRGREPEGTVDPHDAPAILRDVASALLALRDPWTHAPVVAEVHRREDLYRGPCLHRAPDLVLSLHLDRGYSYNLMPSSSAPPGTGPFRRLSADEHLGKKGRSLPGSHRDHGLLIAAGPHVRGPARVACDMLGASALLLARMEEAIPHLDARLTPELIGHLTDVPQSVLDVYTDPSSSPPRAEEEPAAAPALSPEEERIVSARLRALGYID